jgi:hypothetical protein
VTPRNIAIATAAAALVAGATAVVASGVVEAGLAVAVVVVALAWSARAVIRVAQTLRAIEPAPGRPGFAKPYPRTRELDRLVRAFSAGNFALVRREAPRLAEKTEDESVRTAALDLRRRIAPDPTAIYLLVVGLALAVAVAIYYFRHGH